jgi:hypothetical protein
MAYKDNLTAEYVRSILGYDMETGVFTWKVREDVPPEWNTRRAGDPPGYITDKGYLSIGINNSDYMGHRLAWLIVHGEWPSRELDHHNGNKSDNRIINLRISTQAQNTKNRSKGKNNTSGYKGVYYNKINRKWIAQITINYKVKYLGSFDTAEQAAQAYNKAALEYHGEFAKLNEIPIG